MTRHDGWRDGVAALFASYGRRDGVLVVASFARDSGCDVVVTVGADQRDASVLC